MKTKILSLFTRTPLHVGCGSSVGAVDQPVVRERHTGYPVIPGTAIKGVLADLWNEAKTAANGATAFVRSADGVVLFGSEDMKNAASGKLLIGEGRLLAFPIRSAKGAFAWLTCPLALHRCQRDCGLNFSLPEIAVDAVLVTAGSLLKLGGDKVVFEEYPLSVAGEVDASVVEAFQGLCSDGVWADLPKRLAVVSDELFRYFVENACEIANHNRIDDVTGVVAKGALFSQENVPSETLFYSLVQAADAACLEKLKAKVTDEGGLLQIGADATTGLGWCTVSLKEVK